MTLAQTLQQGRVLGLTLLDAQLLLLHALQRDDAGRTWLLTHDTDTLDAASWQRWQALVQRRLHGEPVAYLLGRREFFGLNLMIDRCSTHVQTPKHWWNGLWHCYQPWAKAP